MFKRSVVVFLFLMICVGPVPALAKESPKNVLKRCVDDVILILNDPAAEDGTLVAERNRRLFEKAGIIFDFRSLAMGALGRNWRRFNNDQRTEFSDSFSRLIAQSYFSRMEGQDFDNVSIEYKDIEALPPTRSGIQRADVPTDLIHNGVKTPVTYRMLKRTDTWKVYDVVIEGISMVSNYREQYRNSFKDSPEKMINDLKEKLQ
ncbi:MAG: ABC transporter substrate-binding protein [Desulfobacteraceae bacterium]|nr:ABC transporter substrate-binding protein [Desulfobacteraceae bacterium]